MSENSAARNANYMVPPGYDVIKPLGTGGFGIVSLAKHLDSGAYRAVKMIITEDHQAVIRVQKEINVLKSLNHPNIACFVDSHADEFIFYLVLEYYERGDLNRYLRDKERTPREVPPNLKLLWFRQLALAIAVSHPCTYQNIRTA